ncbi:MAG: hypothetical protein K2J96_06380 [Bacteroidaceae bacterium]|nr:hypothetical protein [Bacteroidaceae bacterium]MDE7165966.1 hypothetical protein [Bacteroidaceae bacterium]
MNAKDSLKNVLDVLHELKKQPAKRQTVIDIIRGIESRSVTEAGWEKMETFGCGDKREEPHYNTVIDQAVDEKMIKEDNGELSVTPKGEKFRKAPSDFILRDETDEAEPSDSDEALLDSLVEEALHDKEEEELTATIPLSYHTAARSQQMIQLIQAIDRKIPLDDYAEQNMLDFGEVLDTLEALVRRGTKLDIHYFIDEVMEKECQEELLDFFDEVDGDVERTVEEFYGVYQPEEIRLMRLIWKK